MSNTYYIIFIIIIIYICKEYIKLPRNLNQEKMIKLTGQDPPNWWISDNINLYICEDGECIVNIYDIYSGFPGCKLTNKGINKFKDIIYSKYENVFIIQNKIIMNNFNLDDLLKNIYKINNELFDTSLSIFN